jgi:hypothetical protein
MGRLKASILSIHSPTIPNRVARRIRGRSGLCETQAGHCHWLAGGSCRIAQIFSYCGTLHLGESCPLFFHQTAFESPQNGISGHVSELIRQWGSCSAVGPVASGAAALKNRRAIRRATVSTRAKLKNHEKHTYRQECRNPYLVPLGMIRPRRPIPLSSHHFGLTRNASQPPGLVLSEKGYRLT